jgi:hypothetical protein
MGLFVQHVQKHVRLECFWTLEKVQIEVFPTVPPKGQTDKWKALKLRVKAANVPKWAQRSQGSTWESGGVIKGGGRKASDGI